MYRDYWYNGNKITALRIIKNLSVDNKKTTDYLLCKNKAGDSLILDLKKSENLIPCELYKGDRIMIFNHSKLHGIASIGMTDNGCAIISNVPSYMHSDFIPAKVEESGLVMKSKDNAIEIYVYHPLVCSRFGIKYRNDAEDYEEGETILTRTSAGDKEKINIRKKKADNGATIYAVTTDVYTKYPEEYGLDFMCIAEDEDGNFIIRCCHQYQYKTWMLITEKIKRMHESEEGDK